MNSLSVLAGKPITRSFIIFTEDAIDIDLLLLFLFNTALRLVSYFNRKCVITVIINRLISHSNILVLNKVVKQMFRQHFMTNFILFIKKIYISITEIKIQQSSKILLIHFELQLS